MNPQNWRGWLLVVVTLALLFFETGGYWSATWLSKWALLTALGCGGLAVWAAVKTSLWHLPLLLYAFGSLLAVAAWPQHPYTAQLDAITMLALQKNAFAGLAELAVCVGFVVFLCRNASYLMGALVALPLLWLVGVGGLFFLPLTGPRSAPNNGLWFGNPSMAASLLACLLPFVWAQTRDWAASAATWFLTMVVVYLTRASVPWGVLGAVTAAAWAVKRPRLAVGSSCLLALALVMGGKWLLGDSFWDENGRFEIWRMAWDWFRAHGNLAVGMGYSTTQILVPLEQVLTNHYHDTYFLWLHNDWLQLLIEGGLIGAACTLVSVVRLLWLSKRRSALFGSLVGFVVLACFNYPLRMPIHCFVLVLVVALIEATSATDSRLCPNA